MSENKHTPGPWHMRLSDNATPHIEYGDCYLDEVGELRNRICVMPAEISQSFNSFQNARRIVACVNACAGIETEYLEHFGGTTFNDFKRVKEQRDELLAVLDQAANGQHLDDVPNHDDDSLRCIAYRLPDNEWHQNALLRHAERINAAITSVKGIKLTDNE